MPLFVQATLVNDDQIQRINGTLALAMFDT